MKRYCKRCMKVVEGKVICPHCRAMTGVLPEINRELTYVEHEPPTAERMLARKKGLDPSALKVELQRGAFIDELNKVKLNLERELYYCSNCRFFVEGGCLQKRQKVRYTGICRDYLPRDD